MKLSNKILLGFFGFIFLYLTAAFAELRISGIPNILNHSNSIAETVNISAVSHLKIKGIRKHIDVIGSDRAELEVLSFSGNVLKKLTYEISGDTLVLSGLQTDDKEMIKVSVYIPKAALRGITVDHSSASVNGLESEVLHLIQTSGSTWMNESSIVRMNLNLSDALLEISNTNVDSLSAQAEKSRVNIYSSVGVVDGTLTNGTVFYITDLKSIQLKKDTSSLLKINQ